VSTDRLVEALDVVKDVGLSLRARGVMPTMHLLLLQTRPKALHGCVVVTIPTSTHGRLDAKLFVQVAVLAAGVLGGFNRSSQHHLLWRCLRHDLSGGRRQRLAEAYIEPSVGSKGDSYDNALAETINGLYKAEVIHRRSSWKTVEAVEMATFKWVAWFNHQRLLEPIRYTPPDAAEANYYAALATRETQTTEQLTPA
jgi:Integrase core domain